MNGNACTCVDVILREKIREKESKPTELDLKISEEVKGPNVTTCIQLALVRGWHRRGFRLRLSWVGGFSF